MSLKREMLVEAGIVDKNTLDNIMKAYGSAIENAKVQAKSELEAENQSLKEQLEAQTNKVDELVKDSEINAETKKALEDLKNEYNQFKTDSESKLAQVNKTNAIALALKDVKAYDSDVLMKLIDVDKVELEKDGKPKLDTIISELKESKPFLFEKEQQEQNNNPQIIVGGNPDGTGGKPTDPFQAIIDSYK